MGERPSTAVSLHKSNLLRPGSPSKLRNLGVAAHRDCELLQQRRLGPQAGASVFPSLSNQPLNRFGAASRA